LRKLAVDPANSAFLLLATVDGGLLESRDSGATWALEDPNRYAWVGFHDSGVGAAMAIPWRGTVARRASRDAAWTVGASLNVANFFDAIFDPHDPDPIGASSLFVLTSGEPLFSADGGTTLSVRSQGLRGSSVTHLSAADDGTVYAAYSEGPVGVHRRSAGSWAPVDNAELMSRLFNFFNPLVMEVDSTDSSLVLLGSGSELVRSQDGGQSWSFPSIDANVAGRLPRSLAFARSNSQHVYLGLADGFGVVFSENAGLTWQVRSNGLPTGTSVGALAVDPANSLVVYAGGFLSQAQPVLYKTTNGGMSWAAMSSGLDILNLQTIAVARSSNQSVYAGAAAPGQGLAKSTNGGQTWQRVGGPIADGFAIAVAVDATVPTTIYMTANLTTGGAARSVDGGASWENLPQGVLGLGLLGRMVLDPLQPGRLLAAAPHYGLMEFTVSPDLEATMTVAPVIGLGVNETATVRVRNVGPFAASAVDLRIVLPPDITAGVPTSQQGACAEVGTAFECALGAVRAGQSVDTTLVLSTGNAPASGPLTAVVTGRESDLALANNQVSAPLTVTSVANMALTLSSSLAAVAQGASVAFTATARNSGPQDSPSTEIVIDVGTGFTYQSASVSQGSCTAIGARVTCALGSLANAAEASATVNLIASGTGTLTTSASVSTSITDTFAANNAAAANVTSQSPAGDGGRGGGGSSRVLELLYLFGVLLVVTWRREAERLGVLAV
jgi:hypothetical protein